MNKKLLWIMTAAMLTSFMACSEDSGTSSSKGSKDPANEDQYVTVSSIKDLGKCGSSAKGDSIYVESLSALYQCDGKTWKIVEEDESGKDEDVADDKDDSDKGNGGDSGDEKDEGISDDTESPRSSNSKASSSSKRTSFDDDDDDSVGDDKSDDAPSSASSAKSSAAKSDSDKGDDVTSSDDATSSNSGSKGDDDVIPGTDPESPSSSSVKRSSASKDDADDVTSSDDATSSNSGNKDDATGDDPESPRSSSAAKSSASTAKSSAAAKSSNSISPIVPTGPVTINEIADKLSMADMCDIFTLDHVVYVQDDEKAYICTENGYVEILIEEPVVKSSSSAKVSSSSKTVISSSDAEVVPETPSSSSVPFAGTPVSFVDTRDNQEYSLVTIGSQTWMAENLNYVTEGGYADDKIGSWCYKNSEDNCADYGRLYTWAAAMKISDTYNSSSYTGSGNRGICPDGLHMPSKADWQTLKDYIAASKYTLKQYGFTTQTSGHYQESEDDVYLAGFDNGPKATNPGMEFWSATQFGETNSYHVEFFSGSPITINSKYKVHAYAVRCLKDALDLCDAANAGTYGKTNEDILICKADGDDYAWQFANESELLDYYFGKCSATLLNKYNEKDGYAYICKRSINSDKKYVYGWEVARDADYIAYVLNDTKCSDGTVKEGRPLNAYPLDTKLSYTTQYYCDEGVWRTATTLEYDTYGQECKLNRVTAGAVNENRYYYCDEDGWRTATTLEYDTDGKVCIEGKIISGNVNSTYSYICDDGAWRSATTLEVETYEKVCDVEGKVVRGNNNSRTYYYCNAKTGWRIATVTEYDTYQQACEDGVIVYGRVNNSTRYYCEDGAWRAPTTLEVDTYQQTCENGLIINGNVYMSNRYYCDAGTWRTATTLEIDTYQQKCTDKLIITGIENKSTYYYCEAGKWRLATTKDRDIDGVECVDGETFYGKVTGATYICGKDEAEYLLSFEGNQVPTSSDLYVEIPFNQEVCFYVEFYWTNDGWIPNSISVMCNAMPVQSASDFSAEVSIEMSYNGVFTSSQGRYYASNSIALGGLQVGRNVKDNVCVTVTGTDGGTAKCYFGN